jgi:hypothetical protein
MPLSSSLRFRSKRNRWLSSTRNAMDGLWAFWIALCETTPKHSNRSVLTTSG